MESNWCWLFLNMFFICNLYNFQFYQCIYVTIGLVAVKVTHKNVLVFISNQCCVVYKSDISNVPNISFTMTINKSINVQVHRVNSNIVNQNKILSLFNSIRKAESTYLYLKSLNRGANSLTQSRHYSQSDMNRYFGQLSVKKNCKLGNLAVNIKNIIDFDLNKPWECEKSNKSTFALNIISMKL